MPQPLPPIAWVDDLVLLVESESDESLIEQLGQLVCIVDQAAAEAGLELNMSSGKTEAILNFSGSGAAKSRRTVLIDQCAQITVVGPEGAETKLRVAPESKHLGQILAPDAGVGPEIRRRIALANCALSQLRKSIFRNKGLSLGAGITILESTVLSRLLFGSQSWHKPGTRASRVLEGFYMKALRSATKCIPGPAAEHFSNTQVLSFAGLPSVEWQLRKRRLLHLSHLVLRAPHVVLQLLLNEDKKTHQSWLNLVAQDITCMTALVGCSLSGLEAGFTWERLFGYVRQQPKNGTWRFVMLLKLQLPAGPWSTTCKTGANESRGSFKILGLLRIPQAGIVPPALLWIMCA